MEMEVCIGLHLFNSEKQKAKCKREYGAEEDDCKTQGQLRTGNVLTKQANIRR